jgi:hypothetical protein
MYPRRLKGVTRHGDLVEIQAKDETSTDSESITFEKDGQKITDKVILRIWVLNKPKFQYLKSEKGGYDKKIIQNASCYVLTAESGWVAQYMMREVSPFDGLDNKESIIDQYIYPNGPEHGYEYWNIYQSSTVKTEDLVINLKGKLV